MSNVHVARDAIGRRRFVSFDITDADLAMRTRDRAEAVVEAALNKVAEKLAGEIWVALQPHLHDAMKRAAAGLEEEKSK